MKMEIILTSILKDCKKKIARKMNLCIWKAWINGLYAQAVRPGFQDGKLYYSLSVYFQFKLKCQQKKYGNP